MKFNDNHGFIIDYEILENAIMFKFADKKLKDKEFLIHESSNGYAFICINSNKIMVHRIIAEYMMGSELGDELSVHHIDRNKKNNSIENIQVMHQSLHNYIHGKEIEHDLSIILKHQKMAVDVLRRKDVTESKVKELHDMGYGYRRIAKILHCSRNTVRRRLGVIDVYGYKPKSNLENEIREEM